MIDVCCGAGGAGVGYNWAGWDVIGVDIEPQPNYPFEFHQMDLRELKPRWLRRHFDAAHGSPPCQFATRLQTRLRAGQEPNEHVNLIPECRALFHRAGLPYVIENVPDASDHLCRPVRLCGSMFGLDLQRHRLFECGRWESARPLCNHDVWVRNYPAPSTRVRNGVVGGSRVVQVYGTGGGAAKDLDLWRWAMETPWMQTRREVAESIPPRYTEFLGAQLLEAM